MSPAQSLQELDSAAHSKRLSALGLDGRTHRARLVLALRGADLANVLLELLHLGLALDFAQEARGGMEAATGHRGAGAERPGNENDESESCSLQHENILFSHAFRIRVVSRLRFASSTPAKSRERETSRCRKSEALAQQPGACFTPSLEAAAC